jgi:hypothetical protein
MRFRSPATESDVSRTGSADPGATSMAPSSLAAPSGPANPTEESGITTAGASRRLVAIEPVSPRRRRREGSDDWLAPGVDADLDGMACKDH